MPRGRKKKAEDEQVSVYEEEAEIEPESDMFEEDADKIPEG